MDYRKMDEMSMSARSMPSMPVGLPVIFIKNLSKDEGPVDKVESEQLKKRFRKREEKGKMQVHLLSNRWRERGKGKHWTKRVMEFLLKITSQSQCKQVRN